MTRRSAVVARFRRERVLLVVGPEAELASSLRDRLDRRYVTVVDARPGEEIDAIGWCHPWPWMVVGSGDDLSAALTAELGRGPILLVWRGQPPRGLPTHALATRSFGDLVVSVEAALGAVVAGMRLAIGGGVDLPDGTHVASASLEALIGAHPRPLQARTRFAPSAARVLARHGLSVRPRTVPGGVVLAAAAGA